MELILSINRLQMLYDMLMEVHNGTWKPTLPYPGYDKVEYVKFNMRFWGSKQSCGFAACAFGHALMDERFMNLRGILKDSATKTEAAMYFFGISLIQAERIFIPGFSYDMSKIKPIEVANVVKSVIQECKDDYNRYNDFINS